MHFEYDESKSRANLEKHGIDFETAQLLWEDPRLLEIPTRVSEEPRYLIVAFLQQRYWSAIVTYRQDSVRIISVRRSRQEEIKLYEKL
jgi:uncharacterized DUF497 family protein